MICKVSKYTSLNGVRLDIEAIFCPEYIVFLLFNYLTFSSIVFVQKSKLLHWAESFRKGISTP